MQTTDFDAFRQVLNQLGEVFGGKVPSDAVVRAYWDALRDIALSTVEHHAQACMRHGKFFPKPRELRPAEAREAPPATGKGDAFRDGEARSTANLEELRRESPARWLAAVSERVYAVGRRKGMRDDVIADKLRAAAYAP